LYSAFAGYSNDFGSIGRIIMKIKCETVGCPNLGIVVDVFIAPDMNQVVICCCGQVFEASNVSE
jgi:hypothetical protein